MLNKSRIGLYHEDLIGYYYKLLENPPPPPACLYGSVYRPIRILLFFSLHSRILFYTRMSDVS